MNDQPPPERPQAATGSRQTLTSVLRSPALGWLWLVVAVMAAGCWWQQIVGWPGSQTVPLPHPSHQRVQETTIPALAHVSDWNGALVEVWAGHRRLPRYVSREALEDSVGDGFAVKGKTVAWRAQEEGLGEVRMRLPNEGRASRLWVLTLTLLVSTAILSQARNRVVQFFGEWMAGWLRREGGRWVGVALAAVVVSALALRIFGFSFPAWFNDTDGYYRQVFAVVHGAHPSTTPDRPFGYPLAMGLLLRLTTDLRAVVIAQESATFGAAASVAAILWLAGPALLPGLPGRLGARLLAVFSFAALTLNEALLQREWALLSEAWTALYLGAQAFLTWQLTARPRSLSSGLFLYALLCASGLMTFFTKGNWGFALAFLPVPWVAATVLNTGSRSDFLRWSAAGAAALLLLAALGFGYQAHCSRLAGLASLQERARALVCWHVPQILPEIDRRLASQPDAPDRALWEEMSQVLKGEMRDSKTSGAGAYPSLGYDADDLYFERLPKAPLFSRLTPEQRTTLCMGLFKDAVRHDPMAYWRKVAGQMPIFFLRPYQKVSISRHLVAGALTQSEQAAEQDDVLPPEYARPYAEVLRRARAEFAEPWPSASRQLLCDRMRIVFTFLAASFRWALMLPLLLCLAALAQSSWRERIAWRRMAPALTVALWSGGSVILSALSSAVTQGLDIPRYIQLCAPLTLLAELLWPLIGLSVALQLMRKRG